MVCQNVCTSIGLCSIQLSYFLFGLFTVILMFLVTRVAKAALEKALAENEDLDIIEPPELPLSDTPGHLNEPLLIKIDPSEDHHEK